MKKINVKTFYKISMFAFVGTFVIIVTILFYEFLASYIPETGTFLGLNFNPLWFIFSLIIAVVFPIIIYLFFHKHKQKLDKRRKL